MNASSQSIVSRNARQPPVSPLASPGGGVCLGLAFGFALTTAFGPTRVSVTVA